MDEILNQRLKTLEEQLEALRTTVAVSGDVISIRTDIADVHVEVANFKAEVTTAFRNLDLRVTTEIRETAALIRDLKAWLVERDDTRLRIAKLEDLVTQLQKRVDERASRT